MDKPYHLVSAAERLTARIAQNREFEAKRRSEHVSSMTLDEIVGRLSSGRRRASYGAVAAIVGVLLRGLMSGRRKCHEDSSIVAVSGPRRGWPTDYTPDQIHPDCLRQIRAGQDSIIEAKDSLLAWLQTQEAD